MLHWIKDITQNQGYHKGLSSPCLYCREEDSHGWRHGDELEFVGDDKFDQLQTALARVMLFEETSKIGVTSERR